MESWTLSPVRIAHNEGVIAAYRVNRPGRLRAATCPYPEGTQERRAWFSGLEEGMKSRAEFDSPHFE